MFEKAVVPTIDDLLAYAASRGIVGEEQCFITASLAMISPKLNILVESPSGAGKTTIVDPIMDLYEHYRVEVGSAKNSIYDDELRVANVIYLPELQKAVLSGDFLIEMLKNFGEGKSYTYTVTYKAQDGKFRVQKRVIPPKSFITTIAIGNKHSSVLDAELGRRIIRLFTDTSVKMNERVIEEYAKHVSGQSKRPTAVSPAYLRGHLSKSRQCYNSSEIIVPYADAIGDAIDKSFVVSRSIFKQMIELVKCVALFRHPEGKVIVANMDDLGVFVKYIFENLQNQAMQLPTLGVRILEVFADYDGEDEDDILFGDDNTISMAVSEVQKKMRGLGYVIDTKVLMHSMDTLVEAGYLALDESTKGRIKRYRTTGHTREYGEINITAAKKQYERYMK